MFANHAAGLIVLLARQHLPRFGILRSILLGMDWSNWSLLSQFLLAFDVYWVFYKQLLLDIRRLLSLLANNFNGGNSWLSRLNRSSRRCIINAVALLINVWNWNDRWLCGYRQCLIDRIFLLLLLLLKVIIIRDQLVHWHLEIQTTSIFYINLLHFLSISTISYQAPPFSIDFDHFLSITSMSYRFLPFRSPPFSFSFYDSYCAYYITSVWVVQNL